MDKRIQGEKLSNQIYNTIKLFLKNLTLKRVGNYLDALSMS